MLFTVNKGDSWPFTMVHVLMGWLALNCHTDAHLSRSCDEMDIAP